MSSSSQQPPVGDGRKPKRTREVTTRNFFPQETFWADTLKPVSRAEALGDIESLQKFENGGKRGRVEVNPLDKLVEAAMFNAVEDVDKVDDDDDDLQVLAVIAGAQKPVQEDDDDDLQVLAVTLPNLNKDFMSPSFSYGGDACTGDVCNPDRREEDVDDASSASA
ncbi:hypothetical protein M758_9G137400 [Ceratodon purpureus]|nr:hypothetical protein M758_9G137400 [Ceratodon purpureus]